MQYAKDNINFFIDKGTNYPSPTVKRGKGRCLFCSSVISNEEIVKQIKEYNREKLIAVIYRDKTTVGANFRLPNNNEIKSFKENEQIQLKIQEIQEYIPKIRIPSKVIMVSKYLETWDRVFFPRQILLLSHIIKYGQIIIKKKQKEFDNEFGIAIGFYIACLITKVILKNSRISGWQSNVNVVRNNVAFRTYPIIWEHVEIHPFDGESGSLKNSISGVLSGLEEAVEYLKNSKGTVKITNESILSLTENGKFDAIITDPPYLDDVPYPEVSDLFYIWQKKLFNPFIDSLNPIWLRNETPREEDLSSNRYDRTNDFVNMGLSESFKVIYRLLKDNGTLALFYAHSKLEAWEFVVNALMEAGFCISATYPLATEHIGSPITAGKASIFSSILLFAKKRQDNRKGILEDLTLEIEAKIYPRLEEFWNSGIRHTDLTGAAIGPVLEIITGYSELKSKFGKINVINILELASQYVINFVLSKYTTKYVKFDPISAFYLYISIENINNKKKDIIIPYDNAHILSKSINVDLSFIERQGLIDDGGSKGKKNRVIRLLGHNMRKSINGSSLIDAVHRIMNAYSKKGIKEMQETMKQENYNVSELKIALELLSKAENPPGKDGDIAKRILGLRENVKKADITLIDFFS